MPILRSGKGAPMNLPPHRILERPWVPLSATIAVAASALLAACSPAPSEPAPAVPVAATEFAPTATVQDIMLSLVDPSADAIWNSVATIVTLEGTEERRPRTDEEWGALRHEAITLVEATNLLLMDGRR